MSTPVTGVLITDAPVATGITGSHFVVTHGDQADAVRVREIVWSVAALHPMEVAVENLAATIKVWPSVDDFAAHLQESA